MGPDAPTSSEGYARRLEGIQLSRWKQRLRRLDPYGIHLRHLKPGLTLEIGCGIGRNLAFLRGLGVGVDHNPAAVATARGRGLCAYTPSELPDVPRMFDTLLFSHVLEHLGPAEALGLVSAYLPRLRPDGRLVIVCPQERGYASDPTHLTFVDFDVARGICQSFGLVVVRQRSFPLPRSCGRAWVYNEFVTVASRGSPLKRGGHGLGG